MSISFFVAFITIDCWDSLKLFWILKVSSFINDLELLWLYFYRDWFSLNTFFLFKALKLLGLKPTWPSSVSSTVTYKESGSSAGESIFYRSIVSWNFKVADGGLNILPWFGLKIRWCSFNSSVFGFIADKPKVYKLVFDSEKLLLSSDRLGSISV